MTEAVPRFLLYNLGASFVAGLWTLGLVFLVLSILGIRSATVRHRLLAVPLLKSTLVLAGLCTVMPIPSEIWRSVQARAIPIETLGPFLLLALGGGVLAFPYLRHRAAASRRRGAELIEDGQRAAAIATRLGERFEVPSPLVYRTERGETASVVDGDPPAIFLPASLESQLDDEELEGVLAHELAHVTLRQPDGCCDPNWLRPLTWLSPSRWTAGRLLRGEEELACDEMAARITGKPEALASALVKSYRFHRGTVALRPAAVATFLGGRGLLRRRLARLLEGDAAPAAVGVRVSLAWAIVLVVAFLRL